MSTAQVVMENPRKISHIPPLRGMELLESPLRAWANQKFPDHQVPPYATILPRHFTPKPLSRFGLPQTGNRCLPLSQPHVSNYRLPLSSGCVRLTLPVDFQIDR